MGLLFGASQIVANFVLLDVLVTHVKGEILAIIFVESVINVVLLFEWRPKLRNKRHSFAQLRCAGKWTLAGDLDLWSIRNRVELFLLGKVRNGDLLLKFDFNLESCW